MIPVRMDTVAVIRCRPGVRHRDARPERRSRNGTVRRAALRAPIVPTTSLTRIGNETSCRLPNVGGQNYAQCFETQRNRLGEQRSRPKER